MGKLIERHCDNWSADSIGVGHTASRLARELLFYVQTVGYFKTRPPYFTERVNLDSFLLICTLKGRGLLELEDAAVELVPGTCAFINCMDYHRYCALGTEQWEFRFLHFNGSNLPDYYREFTSRGVHAVALASPQQFSDTLARITTLQPRSSVSAELQVNQQIVSLLTELMLACNHLRSTPGAWPGYLQGVVQELEENFAAPLSLEQLAGKYGVSKFHLSREFKRLVGMNFSDYLTAQRMRCARQLLSFTDLPVQEVARKCGFGDTSHFIRVFRQHQQDKTPLAYRKQWQ